VTIPYATNPYFPIIEQILSVSWVNKSNKNFLKSSNLASSTPPLLRGCSHPLFSAKETAEARTYFEFEWGSSKVRSAFAKE